MPKFNVTMSITNKKVVTVYAKDEQHAEEKAVDLVNGWQNVLDCEALEVEEESN